MQEQQGSAPEVRPDSAVTFVIGAPELTRTPHGAWRLETPVNGRRFFIESDAPLAATADAALCMMLLPAARAKAALRIDADVDRRLYEAVPSLQAIARRYWNFAGGPVTARGLVDRRPQGSSAMFFSGGVDSFHTLRRRRDEVERLVFLRGFDIGLDDSERFAKARAWIGEVGGALGIPTVIVRSDLRQHSDFRRLKWSAAHGAAMAAIAHALAPVASRFYFASGDMRENWGSTPELDVLWSSSAVDFVNDGAESRRLDKVRAIADWPLVHRFLRVCWEHRSTALNCGACEKCVRTQAMFAIAGALDRIETFPRAPLAELVDGVPYVLPNDVHHWRAIAAATPDANVAAAVGRLLERRPSPVDWLRARTDWLKRVPGGRAVRAIGRTLLGRR